MVYLMILSMWQGLVNRGDHLNIVCTVKFLVVMCNSVRVLLILTLGQFQVYKSAQQIYFFFLNQNMSCGYSKEPSQ